MCTVAFLWKTHPDAALVVGMNRDEFKARPSADVHLWPADDGNAIVAGKDLVSDGAWFAFGETVFAALTNDRDGDSAAPGRHSRGDLVVQAARASSAAEAAASLSKVEAAAFGRFHLLVADKDTLFWLTNTDADATQVTSVQVAPGAHVLGNFGLDRSSDEVVQSLFPKVASLQHGTAVSVSKTLDQIEALMREPGPTGPCIDFGPYGTRSSAVASVFGEEHLRVSNAAPTASPYADADAMLAALRLPQPLDP